MQLDFFYADAKRACVNVLNNLACVLSITGDGIMNKGSASW